MSEELKQLEFQKETNEHFIKRMQLIEKLQNNYAFKKVILEEFCEKECAAYAKASGDANLTKEDRESAMAIAQAAGHLQRFLQVCIRMGLNAQSQMEELNNTIDEVRANND